MEVKVAVVRVLCDRKNMLCGVDGLVLRFGNGMEWREKWKEGKKSG